jgi:hypothetical protein
VILQPMGPPVPCAFAATPASCAMRTTELCRGAVAKPQLGSIRRSQSFGSRTIRVRISQLTCSDCGLQAPTGIAE